MSPMFFIWCSNDKGQLISKENYLDLDSSKKATRAEVLGSFFGRIENK